MLKFFVNAKPISPGYDGHLTLGENDMGKTAIESLAEEMIVGKDVYDFKERLLLKKGTVLSKALIEKLNKYGIKEIYVADPGSGDDRSEAEIEAQRARELIEDLEIKFSDFSDNKLMNDLKEVIKEYLQEKIPN
jgi:hypothetical protein